MAKKKMSYGSYKKGGKRKAPRKKSSMKMKKMAKGKKGY